MSSPLSVQNTVLNALLIITLVLGYKVYQVYVPEGPTLADITARNVADTPSSFADMADLQLIRSIPNPEESGPDAMQEFSREAETRATVTNDIEITDDCTTTPRIVSLSHGDVVTFTNRAEQQHTVRLTSEITELIEPGGVAEIAIDFETGTGIYGYVCDDAAVLSGILLVR